MSDPRATQVFNTAADDEEISQVLTELQGSHNVNAFFVLSKYLDCPEVKNEPQFCQILFNEHIEVIVELIEWMLIPRLVVKKKKIKTNVDSYPYQCRNFMEKNWCFYEQMYIAARNKRIDFSIWFNFLRKEYFDKETIYTALGYFTDVMIPFALYQFSGSFSLTQSLQISSSNKNIETLSIMKIIPEQLIQQLIGYCHYEPIHKFLKTAILISIQDPRDYQIAKGAMIKILNGVKAQGIFSKFPILTPQASEQMAKAIDFLDNVSSSFKQIAANIQPNNQFSFRTTALISCIVQSKIIPYVIDQLPNSRLCGLLGKDKQRMHSSANMNSQLSNSQEYLNNSGNALTTSTGTSLSLSMNMSQYTQSLLPSLGNLSQITDSDEEDLVQILFKILSSLVETFARIPRFLNVTFDPETPTTPNTPIQFNSSREFQDALFLNPKPTKHKAKQFTFEEYSDMTTDFREQMQYVLDHMQTLSKFVFNQTENGLGSSFSKVLPFSSGENVKVISFMKYEYFKLVHNCLHMVQIKGAQQNITASQTQTTHEIENKDGNKQLKRIKSILVQPFDFKIDRIHIIEVVKKYLNQNRWNNLAHHLLQKICHLLIMCNYEYIKKNIQKDKNNKFSSNFLAYLIEHFTKREFVFLNTVKFTTQGNLHSLYNIAKDLAYTLNSTNQLVIFLNQFQPWKKFIMTDLKNYEQKIYPNAIKPEEEEKGQDTVCSNLKVDEADSIKKLIQNISSNKKWPTKTKSKSLSKSGHNSLRSSGEFFLRNQNNEQMTRTQIKDGKFGFGKQLALQDILKRKIELGKTGSEIKQFDIQQISVRDKINKQKTKNKIKSEIKDPTYELEQQSAKIIRKNTDPNKE